MIKLTQGLEILAALLLGVVALLSVAEIAMRALFGINIPDAFIIAGYLQGIAIFWGIALTCLADEHISVDLVTNALRGKTRIIVEIIAEICVLALLVAWVWMTWIKVGKTMSAFDMTQQMRLPVWPFIAMALLGITFAVGVVAARLFVQIRRLFTNLPVEKTNV